MRSNTLSRRRRPLLTSKLQMSVHRDVAWFTGRRRQPGAAGRSFTAGGMNCGRAKARESRGRNARRNELLLSNSRCCPALESDGLKSFAVGRCAPDVPAGHRAPREGIVSAGQTAEGSIAKEFDSVVMGDRHSNERRTGTFIPPTFSRPGRTIARLIYGRMPLPMLLTAVRKSTIHGRRRSQS
jgi:hypothetical protein